MIASINPMISFTARSEERKDAEKKVVTGGGAVAATTTAARAKATKSGFDMFASSKKVSQGMKDISWTTRTLSSTVKKSTTLWGKVCENAKWAKNSIIGWSGKFKNSKLIRPLVQNKLFRGCAGALGYGFGIVTLISGLSDIAKVTTDAMQNKFSK